MDDRGCIIDGCITARNGRIARLGTVVEEEHGHRSPDQGDDTLSNHRAVKHRPGHTLALHAACHQRGLSGMEATNGTAGYGDKQTGEQAIAGQQVPTHARPQFGDIGLLHQQHQQQGGCHEE